jgi:VPDSG-CTERM motif
LVLGGSEGSGVFYGAKSVDDWCVFPIMRVTLFTGIGYNSCFLESRGIVGMIYDLAQNAQICATRCVFDNQLLFRVLYILKTTVTCLARPLLLSVYQLKIPMRINRQRLIPKLALVSAAVCAAVLAFTPNANALGLTFTDQYVVGTTNPGNPPPNGNVAIWINYMITLGPGQSGTIQNQTVTRSMNVFANLPTANANAPGLIRNENPVGVNGLVHINLGATAGTYSYLFAKYDGQNDISQVWYVGDLSGEITIPVNGPLGHGISVYILFPGTPGGVPDGGTTAMLLGAALGALGMARRFLKI